MDTSILLSSASFLMSHDAATGYIRKGSLSPFGRLVASYSKNQVGTAYDQLNGGARALDLRPKLLANGTVIFHHGDINIPVSFEQLVSDAVKWCSDNDDELVLLLSTNFAYQSSNDDDNNDDDNGYALVSAMSSVYKKLGVPYYHCSAVYGLTVAETMELAALPSGGYLLALDGQDKYGSFCGKSNWVESQVVTCYPSPSVKCTDKDSQALAALQQYVLASANNEATDDSSTLGPPADLYEYPFNEIQALWQVDTTSAAMGISHFSTLLDDNKKSKVNAEMVDMVYDGDFNAISLFAVDNVALNGNALLSVLRNTCGQSTLTDLCGKEISKPKMKYMPMSKILFCVLVALYAVVIIRGIMKHRGWSLFPSSNDTLSQMEREQAMPYIPPTGVYT